MTNAYVDYGTFISSQELRFALAYRSRNIYGQRTVTVLCARSPTSDNPFSSIPRGVCAVLHRYTAAMDRYVRKKLFHVFPGVNSTEGNDIDVVDDLLQSVWGLAVQQLGVVHLHPEPPAAIGRVPIKTHPCDRCYIRRHPIPCAADETWFLQLPREMGVFASCSNTGHRMTTAIPLELKQPTNAESIRMTRFIRDFQLSQFELVQYHCYTVRRYIPARAPSFQVILAPASL